MERMTESTKAIITYFAHKIAFINVLRNMSVLCDCNGDTQIQASDAVKGISRKWIADGQ